MYTKRYINGKSCFYNNPLRSLHLSVPSPIPYPLNLITRTAVAALNSFIGFTETVSKGKIDHAGITAEDKVFCGFGKLSEAFHCIGKENITDAEF